MIEAIGDKILLGIMTILKGLHQFFWEIRLKKVFHFFPKNGQAPTIA